MSARKSVTQYQAEVIGRTRAAREKNFKSQKSFAEKILKVPQPTYANYETDRIMPPELLVPFCTLCDVSLGWLLGDPDCTAQGPAWEPYYPNPKPRAGRKPLKRTG